MSLDGAIWDLVGDHKVPAAPHPGNDDVERPAAAPRHDAMVRMLDAVVGLLESTRHLLAVTEEVLKEQRDRMAADASPEAEFENGGGDRAPGRSSRQRIDLTF